MSTAAAHRPSFNPWPVGIVLTFVVFIAGTITLIVIASRDSAELVATDYYDQEIRYQGRIDQIRRTQPWESQITVTHDGTTRTVVLNLPREHAASGATGVVDFYRPSQSGQDQRVPLELDVQGRQVISAARLSAGLWKARLQWSVGDEAYYADRSLVISEPGVAGTPQP